MAAPAAMVLYQSFKAWIGDGTFDLDTDTIKCELVQSTSNFATATNTVLADITNEVASGNGYTTGGVTLTTNTFTQTAGTAAFKTTSAMPAWTGASSGFVARAAVFYKSGTANGHVNPLIGYIILDSAPADVSFAVGNTVTLTMNANGWFTLT